MSGMLTPLRLRGRQGYTLVEVLVVVSVAALISGAVFQAFTGGTRTVLQQSAQTDVQYMGRIALERFINDTRGAFAVVTHAVNPATGRVYQTTAATDNTATPEDDRFTIVLAMPVIDSGKTLIFDRQDAMAAYDAVIWRVLKVNQSSSEGIGYRPTDYRWHLVRTVIPAVWVADRTNTTVDLANNQLTVNAVTGATTYTLGRQAENTDDTSWQALTAATQDLHLDVPQAARFITFKDSVGTLVGGSPVTVTTGLPAANTGIPPADRTAFVTAMDLPTNAGGQPMPVTDVALLDVKLALLRFEASLANAATRDSMQMLSATDVKLRNKRDWN